MYGYTMPCADVKPKKLLKADFASFFLILWTLQISIDYIWFYGMPKFQIYIGLIAIALVSCQQTSTSSLSSPPSDKAISYLRSQLNLSTKVAIVAESQKLQPVNVSDICQTVNPIQEGFQIILVAEDMRYILQTNQDVSKIEICRSEDAKPETTAKYIGAGYILRYPADWKAIDLGLEPSGASTVIFTPSREGNLEKLQQNQQVYAIVTREPIDGVSVPKDGSEIAKDLVTVPFDAKVKGAKSGSKKEFTREFIKESTANNSTNSTIWKVKVLALETDKFIYTIRYYQPETKDPNNKVFEKVSEQVFDQFANSFAIVPSE